MKKVSKEYRLPSYLRRYYKLQKDITLCHRPTEKTSWGDRTKYLSEDYDRTKEYNHRSILECEVIVEYDEEDKIQNRKYVDEVARRLTREGIGWQKLSSGNKSTHLHCMLDTKEATNIPLLKNAFIRVMTKDMPLPDMRLIGKHLIRAETGVHEKTGVRKTLISRTKGWDAKSEIPKAVWEKYNSMMERVVAWRSTMTMKDLSESQEVKMILDTVAFKKVGDGKERALFMLIHLLKPKFKDDKEGLTRYLKEWYRYTNGYKLTGVDIQNKINYHWKRDYKIGRTYIQTFLEELGMEVPSDSDKKQ